MTFVNWDGSRTSNPASMSLLAIVVSVADKSISLAHHALCGPSIFCSAISKMTLELGHSDSSAKQTEETNPQLKIKSIKIILRITPTSCPFNILLKYRGVKLQINSLLKGCVIRVTVA
jgi:hypothetical protein